MNMILALDIGGTFIKWAAADGYELIRQGKTPTPQESLEDLMTAVRCIMEENSDLEITGLAVSYPGMEDPDTGNMVPFGALTYGLNKPVRKIFEAEFGLPVSLENDGRLAALAETQTGSLKDVSTGYVLVIGTGIGGAYVDHGRIDSGRHGYAGQISLFLTKDIRKNGLEAIWCAQNAMPPFLKKAAEELGQEVNGEAFMKLVREGNETAVRLLDEYMNDFTNVLFSLQMLYDPERFVIGGGISADELFIETMQRKYEELYKSLNLEVGHADIVPCRYRNTSNIIGALTLFYSQHSDR